MNTPNLLTLSQLSQRIDELEHLIGKDAQFIESRLVELKKHYDIKTENTFNKGIVNPVPPDKIDGDNPFVITPKAPDMVEREREQWEKSLDN